MIEDTSFSDSLRLGIIASLLAHLTLVVFLTVKFDSGSDKKALPVFEVTVLPELIQPNTKKKLSLKRQIVSEPSSEVTDKPDPNARHLAEKSRTTQKEQIKRGDNPLAGPVKGKSGPPQPKQASSQQQQQQKKTSSGKKKISSLRLSNKSLLDEFVAEEKETAKKQNASRTPSNYRAFSRPAGSGAQFQGLSGLPDHLPNLPDGDITLLNTKANKFAVFVRRVATRVFSKLRASGWESLTSSDIQRLQDFSTVTAILSPTGDLLSVKITGRSGSQRFDIVVQDAARAGSADPHPPKGAEAADGNIHFIFKARSWSRVGASRGGRGMAEQRWLLLSTGLG